MYTLYCSPIFPGGGASAKREAREFAPLARAAGYDVHEVTEERVRVYRALLLDRDGSSTKLFRAAAPGVQRQTDAHKSDARRRTEAACRAPLSSITPSQLTIYITGADAIEPIPDNPAPRTYTT